MPFFDDESDESPAKNFRIQRRRLFFIAIICCFYLFGGVEIKKLSLLGNEITVSSPGVITFCLFFTLCYAHWRFHTAGNEYNIKGLFDEKLIRRRREWEQEHLVYLNAKKLQLRRDHVLVYVQTHEHGKIRSYNLGIGLDSNRRFENWHPDRMIKIGKLGHAYCWIKAWLTMLIHEYEFSEFVIPKYLGWFTVCIFWSRVCKYILLLSWYK